VLPGLGGDLSGRLEAARVESLQGVPLASARRLADGQVLTVAGGRWVPAPPPPPVVPPLGGDVTGALGANAVARLQGRVLNAPNPAPNQILRFVADQWVPVDLPAPPLSVPPPSVLAGDVTGAVGTNVISRLQGRVLNAPNPGPDQILRFVGDQWAAVDLPAAAGQFVGRGTRAPYEIVAAVEVRMVVTNGAVTVTTDPRGGGYGSLVAVAGNLVTERLVDVTLQAAVAQPTTLPNYIVKLTPVWSEANTFRFHPYLFERVRPADTGVTLIVRLSTEQQIRDGQFLLRFHVEVSRY
jgi:hypothetical protein